MLCPISCSFSCACVCACVYIYVCACVCVRARACVCVFQPQHSDPDDLPQCDDKSSRSTKNRQSGKVCPPPLPDASSVAAGSTKPPNVPSLNAATISPLPQHLERGEDDVDCDPYMTPVEIQKTVRTVLVILFICRYLFWRRRVVPFILPLAH